MKHKIQVLVSVIALLLFVSCGESIKETSHFAAELDEIKTQYAPDKRVALFNVTVEKNKGTFILKGESDMADAITALKKKLSAQKVDFIDSIQLLPASELNGLTNAVVTISVANLRSNPKHSAELATQATLGTPVKVLKKEGEWYYIQTPDKYLSWVDHGGITLMNLNSYNALKNAEKIIYTKTYGHAVSTGNENEIVSDLIAGGVLELLDEHNEFYRVKYPDGRVAFVSKKESQPYKKWLKTMNASEESLTKTSKKLLGVPYLWGGTSTKGMDCSGFTKTIYFLNGMVIPRDASQQVHTGQLIDETKNFENLKKGDLLFFGRKATESSKEKVVHVGMWIGNNEFIHASNMVRISSIDPNAENYDEYNLNRYLRTKRIIKQEDKSIINLKQSVIY